MIILCRRVVSEAENELMQAPGGVFPRIGVEERIYTEYLVELIY